MTNFNRNQLNENSWLFILINLFYTSNSESLKSKIILPAFSSSNFKQLWLLYNKAEDLLPNGRRVSNFLWRLNSKKLPNKSSRCQKFPPGDMSHSLSKDNLFTSAKNNSSFGSIFLSTKKQELHSLDSDYNSALKNPVFLNPNELSAENLISPIYNSSYNSSKAPSIYISNSSTSKKNEIMSSDSSSRKLLNTSNQMLSSISSKNNDETSKDFYSDSFLNIPMFSPKPKSNNHVFDNQLSNFLNYNSSNDIRQSNLSTQSQKHSSSVSNTNEKVSQSLNSNLSELFNFTKELIENQNSNFQLNNSNSGNTDNFASSWDDNSVLFGDASLYTPLNAFMFADQTNKNNTLLHSKDSSANISSLNLKNQNFSHPKTSFKKNDGTLAPSNMDHISSADNCSTTPSSGDEHTSVLNRYNSSTLLSNFGLDCDEVANVFFIDPNTASSIAGNSLENDGFTKFLTNKADTGIIFF
ncbi:hypothetical protein AYI68_g1685 [Smittium mucronatum]|uniref:Nitrogen regulatory protein areA GATA-like domain-containing protein n=1 Tax=Smittium mucronatum TaxID=133383 RepID=A0A1R0H4X2_9FUNG|nr:hypothetical protein AYI68_g1685 [Smittium mucronatum]